MLPPEDDAPLFGRRDAPKGPTERRKALEDRRLIWIEAFGDHVQSERERQGLTQGALAKELNMPQSHLSQIENGKSEARLSTLYAFAVALNIPPGTLLLGRGFYWSAMVITI